MKEYGCYYPKPGKKGKAPKYRGYTMGSQVKTVETGFYDSQLEFAKNPEAERMNLYAKPGTSASERQPDPFMVTYPISRYKSRRP